MESPEQKAKHAARAKIRYQRIMADPISHQKRLDRHRAWRDKNKEKRRAFWKTPEGVRRRQAGAAKFFADNPNYIFERNLRNNFGLSAEGYERISRKQNNKCAICKQPEAAKSPRTGLPRRLAVDHHHMTGAIRGLLCTRCNTALGAFSGDVNLLISAAVYLEKHGMFSKEDRPCAGILISGVDEARNSCSSPSRQDKRHSAALSDVDQGGITDD